MTATPTQTRELKLTYHVTARRAGGTGANLGDRGVCAFGRVADSRVGRVGHGTYQEPLYYE